MWNAAFDFGYFESLYIKVSRFRLVDQGLVANTPVLIILFIVYILIGVIITYSDNYEATSKEEIAMNNKNFIEKFFAKSILGSVWSMGSNFLAGALLA